MTTIRRPFALAVSLLALCAASLIAQEQPPQDPPPRSPYGEHAGRNRITESHRLGDGTLVERPVTSDAHGNAAGNRYDLAVDGAFDGQTIVVLQLYEFPFEAPRAALAEKGFSVYRWRGAPSPAELKEALERASQLWVISGPDRQLNEEHLAAIRGFFEAGHGVYIWGDNDPFYADANYVAEALLGVTMSGNLPGDVVVEVRYDGETAGFAAGHPITTGLEFLYEGITIATLADCDVLTPLVHGSAGNLVTAVYDRDGKRAILDGGFTRLYCKWDTAGTGRYVKNAAAWLANYERFGDAVLAPPAGSARTPE